MVDKQYYNAAYRLIGHVIHTIQDSFGTYHCNRDQKTLNIESFYCFSKLPKDRILPISAWKILHLKYDIPY